jgi:hypothetical protein
VPDEFWVYAEVNPTQALCTRNFALYMTGENLPINHEMTSNHLATVVGVDGWMSVHIYELIS